MATLGDLGIRVGFDLSDMAGGAASIGSMMDGIADKIEHSFSGLDSYSGPRNSDQAIS
jgi:hypothetical protein